MITDQTIVTGATIEWEDTFTDYPASDYDLIIYLKLGSAAAVQPTTAKDGDTFVNTIPNTLLTTSGNYQFQYKFTEIATNNVYYPAEYMGVVPVIGSLATSGDMRTADQKVLEELEAARLRVAAREYVSITINGKATQFRTLEQIDSAIYRYKKKLGIIKPTRILSSFG